ncbi:IS1634 family transposase [Actinomyces slackii]|uniref:Transposase n=1 Tax=Actinomyces slackii TaxID=52774 RepID=A0A448KAV8_9ACTO|nr:IS1634 family transposase [Actinomyces slackii]VEG74068.1 Transposase [Actinomyces slackii]
MSPYVRTVRTASGARAVQIVYSSRRGSRSIEHIGSAHDDAQLEALKAVAAQRLSAGQLSLDLAGVSGLEPRTGAAVVPITSSRMGVLLEALDAAWRAVGLEGLEGADEVFRQLVMARLIEPTSKKDWLRVLCEAGVAPVSYATVKRHLPRYATGEFARGLARLLARHARIERGCLVLFDVTTLYFETDSADGFREPGFSKERRLEPQITVGLLTDQAGFPLQAGAFEGNKAETATMIPMIKSFMEAYSIDDVVVVADAGMISAANKRALEEAGLSYILGSRTSRVPHVIDSWIQAHPDQDIPDGLTLAQPWPAGPTDHRLDETIFYRYSAHRARRALRGIDTQVAKAVKAVAGEIPVKRNRFVRLSGATRSVNRDLEQRARALAGWKGYVTNLPNPDPETIISAYHRLYNIEKSFRMSKHDLAARPIYHRLRQSIEAHLTIVTAALAMAHWLETTTGWSIKRLITTTRRYRTITININGHTLTAADPLPPDLTPILDTIHHDTK